MVQSVVSILNMGSKSGSFSSPDLNIPYGVPILHILMAFSLSSKSGKYFINFGSISSYVLSSIVQGFGSDLTQSYGS